MQNVQSIKAEVTQIRDYQDTVDGEHVWVRVFSTALPEGADFAYQPGQFAMVSHDDFERRDDPNRLKESPLSICTSPLQKGRLEFCVRVLDTQGLLNFIGNKVQVGDAINVKGPYGMFTMKEDFKQAYLIAAGTGIAPLISMLRHMALSQDTRPVTFFFGFWNAKTFLYSEELQRYASENDNVQLVTSISAKTDPEWKGNIGYIQETFSSHAFPKDLSGAHAYLCGNPKFVTATLEALPAYGFEAKNIHREQW